MNTKVVITADDQTRAGIESVKTSMAGLGATIGVFAAGATVAAGAIAEIARQTVGLWKDQINLADSMDEMSVRMGMSITQMTSWKAAAEMNGTSLESMAAGTRMLAKHMTEHGAALRKAGIDTTDTNKAFEQLSDMFKGMNDPVARLDLATRLFGRGLGQQLLPMLVQGSEAMREIREATDPYGEALTRLSPEAQKLNDSLYLMGVNFKQAAAEGVFPLVKMFNDQMLPALREVAKEGSLLKTLWVGFGGAMKIGFADPWNQTLLGAKATLQQFMADVETLLAKVTFGKVSALHLREAQRFADAAKKTLAEATGSAPKPPGAAPAVPAANTDATAAALAGGLRNKGGKGRASEADRLIQSIREKVAVTQAEIDGNAKLTEGEKLALKTMVDLRDGKLKATDAEKVKLATDLEALLTNEARLAQMKTERENMEARTKVMGKMVDQDIKVADLIAKTTEANREHADGLRFELSILGLSESAKARAQAMRQIDIKLARDLLAAERELANRVDEDGRNTDLEAAQAQLRDGAEAARREVGAVLDATEARSRDVFAGMSDAATAYFSGLENQARHAGASLTAIFRGVEDVLTKFFETGKLNVKDFFAVIRHEMAATMARQMAAPINQMLSGGITSLLKGVFGGASAPAASMGFGMAGDAGTLLGFAGGGDHAGGFRIVGERGPELEATGPSRIFNAAQTRDILSGANSGDGGVTVNQTLNFAVDSPQAARQAVMAMMPQIQAATVAGVIEARRRGGAMRAAFA